MTIEKSKKGARPNEGMLSLHERLFKYVWIGNRKNQIDLRIIEVTLI